MPDFPKAGSPVDVWTYATRALNSDASNTIRDAVLSDATRIPGANVDASISTRAPELGGNLASVKTRADTILAAEAPTEASVLMDGTEKTLVEITDVKVAEVEAWLDLTPMAGGDTIVVKYYRKVKVAGAYVVYASETYTGAQAVPMVKIIGAKIYRDIKITAQQTAGVNRTLDVQSIRTVTV